MKTGDKLPNGATVLLEKSGVILAVQDSVEPFVTWLWNGTDPASTYWGHYWKRIHNAALDFEDRVERVGGEHAA
jgi:hypothetical protein